MPLKSASENIERKLGEYHSSPDELARTADLMQLVPSGYSTVLDAGARDGYYSKLLANKFAHVTALDLHKPSIVHDRVHCVEGDITSLNFADRSFDVVLCSEVLEHVPKLDRACEELMRVARHAIIVGVPYRQDIRIGRTTCRQCGKIAPPWGHVNSFEHGKLERLFRQWRPVKQSLVGEDKERTNAVAAWLMDVAGNPYGIYDDQTCIHCGSALVSPGPLSLPLRVCAATALRLAQLSSRLTRPHANWIHAVFESPVEKSRPPSEENRPFGPGPDSVD